MDINSDRIDKHKFKIFNKNLKRYLIIDKELLNWKSRQSTKLLSHYRKELHRIERHVLQIKLSYIDNTIINYQEENIVDNVNMNFKNKVNNLLKNIELAQKIISNIQLDNQTSSIRLLTNISTICLPLSIIVGFFGMNFAFMGIDKGGSGIYRWKHSQIIFWIIIILSILIFQIAFFKSWI